LYIAKLEQFVKAYNESPQVRADNKVSTQKLKKKCKELQDENIQLKKTIALFKEEKESMKKDSSTKLLEEQQKNQQLQLLHDSNQATIHRQEEELKDYATLQNDRRILVAAVKQLNEENEKFKENVGSLEELLAEMSKKVEQLTIQLDEGEGAKTKPEIQPLSLATQLKLDKKICTTFKIPEEESVVTWFSCSCGYLYLTKSYLCFDSRIVSRVCIKYTDIVSINKTTASRVLPINSLEVRTNQGQVISFKGFANREETVKAIKIIASKLGHDIAIFNNGRREDQ